MTLPDLTIESLGDKDVVATRHFVSKTEVDDGTEFHLSGAMTIVMNRAEGRWRFVSGHVAPGYPWAFCLGSCTSERMPS